MGFLCMIGGTKAPAGSMQGIADLAHHLPPSRGDVQRRVSTMPPALVADSFLPFQVVAPPLAVYLAVVVRPDPPLVVTVVDVGEGDPVLRDRGLRPRPRKSGQHQTHPLSRLHGGLCEWLGMAQGGVGVAHPSPATMAGDVGGELVKTTAAAVEHGIHAHDRFDEISSPRQVEGGTHRRRNRDTQDHRHVVGLKECGCGTDAGASDLVTSLRDNLDVRLPTIADIRAVQPRCGGLTDDRAWGQHEPNSGGSELQTVGDFGCNVDTVNHLTPAGPTELLGREAASSCGLHRERTAEKLLRSLWHGAHSLEIAAAVHRPIHSLRDHAQMFRRGARGRHVCA